MIIECKYCGNAYKGDIDKPFICPKCISEGITPQDIEFPRETGLLAKYKSASQVNTSLSVEEDSGEYKEDLQKKTNSNFDIVEFNNEEGNEKSSEKLQKNTDDLPINNYQYDSLMLRIDRMDNKLDALIKEMDILLRAQFSPKNSNS